MEKLSNINTILFFLSIAIMLITALTLGIISKKIKSTTIMGELTAGIILGPTVLGGIYPGINSLFANNIENLRALDGIFNLSMIMILFTAGLEIRISFILKYIKPVLLINILGISVPFIAGYSLAWYIPKLFLHPHQDLVFSLFIGTAMSISALPVITTVLIEIKMITTKLGAIIITSAMLTDLIGWIGFSIIFKINSGSYMSYNFFKAIILNLVGLFFIFMVVNLFCNRLAKQFIIKLTYSNYVLPVSICIALLGATTSQLLQLHSSIGAFLAGIAFAKILELNLTAKNSINQFVTSFFTPLFFVSIGFKANFIGNFNISVTIVLIVIACLTKIFGASLGGFIGGLTKVEALLVGVGVNTRGAMEIMLSSLALNSGIISSELFVGLIIMALVTSVISLPALSILKTHASKQSNQS